MKASNDEKLSEGCMQMTKCLPRDSIIINGVGMRAVLDFICRFG